MERNQQKKVVYGLTCHVIHGLHHLMNLECDDDADQHVILPYAACRRQKYWNPESKHCD
jgi:hypothetical protein